MGSQLTALSIFSRFWFPAVPKAGGCTKGRKGYTDRLGYCIHLVYWSSCNHGAV